MANLITVEHDGGWVAIPNKLLEDESLSWKAKGLWAYLQSRPADWSVREKDLVTRSKDGRDSVRSALQELQDSGWLTRDHQRSAGKWDDVLYILHEPGGKPSPEKPSPDYPSPEKPSPENPLPNKTKSNNTEENNTHREELAKQAIHWLTIYPDRDAPIHKGVAIKAYIYARERGASEQELIDAAGKYRSYCASDDRLGTKYVMMPAKFLSDDVWPEWLEHEVEEPKPRTVIGADGLRYIQP